MMDAWDRSSDRKLEGNLSIPRLRRIQARALKYVLRNRKEVVNRAHLAQDRGQ
jgi:hypothetical protein